MVQLKLYRAKLKTRKQIMAEIPREQQGWWADVCPGQTLELREATEADLERCNLGPHAPRDPAEYLCENIERGSLVRRIGIAELTEIPARGLVALNNETAALRDRVQELERQLAASMAAQAPVREVPEGWIACSDRLPDMHTEVMVWPHPSDYIMTAEVDRNGVWSYNEYCSNWGNENVKLAKGRVTHWMPLPAAPVQQEGE